MRTCLSRSEYDVEVLSKLEALLPAIPAARAFRSQYPKSRDEALRELWHRGVEIPNLPDDQAYDRDTLDSIVQAADLAGGLWLAPQARTARGRGRTLAEYRAALADPQSPENVLDCRE